MGFSGTRPAGRRDPPLSLYPGRRPSVSRCARGFSPSASHFLLAASVIYRSASLGRPTARQNISCANLAPPKPQSFLLATDLQKLATKSQEAAPDTLSPAPDSLELAPDFREPAPDSPVLAPDQSMAIDAMAGFRWHAVRVQSAINSYSTADTDRQVKTASRP